MAPPLDGQRLPTPDDPEELPSEATAPTSEPAPTRASEVDVARATPEAPPPVESVARATSDSGKSASDKSPRPTRRNKRVADLPPVVQASADKGEHSAKPDDPIADQRARDASIKSLQARHKRNLATAKRWGRGLTKMLDKGDTFAFRRNGIDYTWDSERLASLGLDVTVIATVLPWGDDGITVVRLTFGEALAYWGAELGISSFEGLLFWLYDHPKVMAVVGIGAAIIQHGMTVAQVAAAVKADIDQRNADAVAAHNAATAGSAPVDTTPHIVVENDEGKAV